MSSKLPVLDTNIIIRFLTADSKLQVEKVERLLQNAAQSSLVIPEVIFAEIVYVLLAVYQLPKEEIVDKMSSLLDYKKFKTNRKLLKKTLEIYLQYPISFPDAYLCALNITGKYQPIYSFDKKMSHIFGVEVKSP